MDEKQKAFEKLSKYYNVDRTKFDSDLESPEGRQKIYEKLNKYYNLPEFGDFESGLTGSTSIEIDQPKKETSFLTKALALFNLFTPSISQDTKSVISHLAAGPEYGVKSALPEANIIANQMLLSDDEWQHGGKSFQRIQGIPNKDFMNQGEEFLNKKPVEKPRTEKQKEYEANLHNLFKEVHDLKIDVKDKYVKSGLIDPKNVGFWDEQAFSIGMNMPYMVLGGSAAKFGLTTTAKVINAIGVPAFTLMEASSHAGDMYGFDAPKDKDGRVLPGKGNLKEAKESLPFGLFAGSLEFFGVSNAVGLIGKLAKNQLKEFGWKTTLKELGKLGAIEGGEEISQDFIGQSDMISQGLQKEYNVGQLLESGKGGAVGGLLLGGFSIGTSYNDIKNLKDYSQKFSKKIDKMEQEKVITKEKADKYRNITKELNDSEIEDLQPAIENLNKVVKEANNDIKELAGEKAFPIAYKKASSNSEKFYQKLTAKGKFQEALDSIIEDPEEQEIYKQRIRKQDDYKNIFKSLFNEAKSNLGVTSLTEEQIDQVQEAAYKSFAEKRPAKMNNILMEQSYIEEIITAHETISEKLKVDNERGKITEKDPKEITPMQTANEEKITLQNPVESKGKEKVPVIQAAFSAKEIKPEQFTDANPKSMKLEDLTDDVAESFWMEEGTGGDIEYKSVLGEVKQTVEPLEWSREDKAGYEVSSEGDARFSALFATLPDGRTIEEAYQLDVKGYRENETDKNWRKGKGKNTLKGQSREQLFKEYKELWRTWANTNPKMMMDLIEKSKGKKLTDKFASSDINQARALSEIINEYQQKKAIEDKNYSDAKSLTSKLETDNNHDSNLKPIVDWMLKIVNPEVRIVNKQKILSDKKTGKAFKMGDSRGAVALENDKFVIYINQDAKGIDTKSAYRTLAHELFHAVTIPELANNQLFKGQIRELIKVMKEAMLDSEFYRLNQEKIDRILANDTEFLSHVIGNTFPELSMWMQEATVPDKPRSTFMQWLKDIFRNLISSKYGKGHKQTFYDSLEYILHKQIGFETTFTRLLDNIQIKETDYVAEDLVDRLDKAFTIVEKDSEDPRIIRAAAEILSDGEEISDYVAFIQSMDFETIKDSLRENEEWSKRAVAYYEKHYKKDFKTLDDYTDAIVRQMYNYAMTLREIPALRFVKTIQKFADNTSSQNVELVELGTRYIDKDGRTFYSYKEDIKLFEAIPLLEDLFKVKIDALYIDETLTQYIDEEGKMTKTWQKISEEDKPDKDGKNVKNASYAQQFEKRGYLFPGTWSDKKSLYALQMYEIQDGAKVPIELKPEMFEAIKKIYEDKIQQFALEYILKIDKELGAKAIDMFTHKDNQKPLAEIISQVFPDNDKAAELVEYMKNRKTTPSEIMRMVLEDIRLGGKINNGQLDTALFDINRSDTYDAIKMFKRPTLVSPKRYVHQDVPFMQKTLDSAPMKDHGMSINNRKLETKAFIFNSDLKQGQVEFEYNGKKYDLGKILSDTFGNETTDGKIIYVLGGFDHVWRKMHGSTKKGAIKAWIGNKLAGSSFTMPFYVKGAYHGVNENEIVAQWMRANKITLLISSSAAKVNGYPTEDIFSDNLKPFTIPFEEIHRDLEKGSVKDGAKGLQQTILANFITPENKGFADEGWYQAIDTLVDGLSERFKDTMNAINAPAIIEYVKEKSLTASSDYEKVISDLVIDLVYTSADKEYAQRKEEYLKGDKQDKDQLRKRLEASRIKNVIVTEQMAEKIANIFHEPYFSKTLKDWIKQELEQLTDFKTPSTWAVLDSDMGYLTQQRYELIEKFIKEEHSLNQLKAKLPTLLKERKRLLKNAEGLTNELVRLNDAFDRAESEKSKDHIASNIERVKKELNETSAAQDLLPLNDDGEIDRKLIPITPMDEKDFLEKLHTIVDPETGKMREGYTMITKDIADYYKIQLGDNIMHLCVPSDSVLSANGSQVVGIMDETLSEPGKIILNSEYIQGVVGKDYDIDTILIIPYSDMFTRNQYDNMVSSLQKSLEKHKKLMLNTYRDKLAGYYFEIKDPLTGRNKKVQGKNLEFKDILKKDVRLAFTQLSNGVSEGRSLFNPFYEGFKILNEYTKDIGKIVNRRKLLTMKSQIGFKTSIKDADGNKIKINPNNPNSWENYLLLLNLTNDMVDMPTNTNKFFYYYNKIKAYDQDNGTSFYDYWATSDKLGKANIVALIETIASIEKFLFSYGTRLTTDYNLDKFGEVRELEDNLRYIAEQQDINKLMDSKGKTEEQYKADKEKLLELYLKKNRNLKGDPQFRNKIASQYISNMKIENTSASPIMKIINSFDINSLPALEMTQADYIKTHADAVIAMLNRPEWAKIKQQVLDAYNRYPQYHWKATTEKGIRPGSYLISEDFTNNDLVLALHLLTSDNINLHYLKAKTIAMLNPMRQKLEKPAKKMGTYVEDIYQEANKDVYPILIKKMFENNKSFIKNNVGEAKNIFKVNFESTIGKISFTIEENNKLFVYYKSNKQAKKIHRFNSSEIAAGINSHAKAVRKAIYGELFEDPKNRISLSNLIFMGGLNVSISDRLEEAARMLNKELLGYTKEDRIKFWTSLLGQPTDNLRFPLNLVVGYKNKTGGKFDDQNKLLNLITMVKDNIGKSILRSFASAFHDNYTGPEFYQSMKIKGLLEAPDIFNSDNQSQIWFEESIQKQVALDKLEDEDPTADSAIDTIFGIHRKDEKYDVPATAIMGKSFNIFTGAIEDITPLQVTQTISAYKTEIQGKISNSLLALTKAIGIGKGLNEMETKEMVRDNLIQSYVDDLQAFVKQNPQRSLEQHITDINLMIENNPLKVKIESNIIEGYVYKTATGIYTDKTIDKLFEDMNVPLGEIRVKHKIAFEYHKRYSVDAIQYLENVIDYLDYIMMSLPRGFNKYNEVKAMRKKYQKLYTRFKKLQFGYIPRVYKKDVFETIWKNENRKKVETRVREMILREQKARAAGKKEIAPYADLVTQAEIDDQIEKELAQDFGALKIDQWGDYVHSFEMKRQVKDPHAGYIKDSFDNHKRHKTQFRQMLLNDMYYLDWLQYEFNAVNLNTKPEIVKRIKRWYKMASGHRMLKTTPIKYQQIKPDDEIQFFAMVRKSQGKYEEKMIRGTAGAISKDKVFMKINKGEMKKSIEDRIERLRTQALPKGARAYLTQKYELENLRDDGYLNNIPASMSVQEAQDLLIEGYFNKLNDEANWGVYSFDQIYTKQFKGIQIVRKEGVRRSEVRPPSDQAFDLANKVSSALLLGGPQSGVRNWIDANWALQKDLRIMTSFILNPKKTYSMVGAGRNFVKDFRSFVGSPKKFNLYEHITKVLEFADQKLANTASTDKHLEIVSALATKYALENGLGKLNQFGNLVSNDDKDTIDMGKFDIAVRKYVDGPKNVLLSFFNRAESGVRLKAAYLYAYKAVMIDKLTKASDIEIVITKGIARTQSLYETIYRRLGEDTRAGALAMKFIQYNSFQLEIKKQELEQMNRMGANKFGNIFRRTAKVVDANGRVITHKAGDSVDPNIANRLAVDLWIDTIGVTLGILMPGFRASNPINKLVINALLQIAMGVIKGETPDEWDLKDWLFSIASFWVGFGVTLPVQMFGYVSGKFGTPIPLITTGGSDPIFPVSPRVGQFAFNMVQLANPFDQGNQNPFLTNKFMQMSEQNYKASQFEKMLLGFNFLIPTRRSYYSDKVNEFQSKGDPFQKVKFLLFDEKPYPNAEFFIPVLNAMKYK